MERGRPLSAAKSTLLEAMANEGTPPNIPDEIGQRERDAVARLLTSHRDRLALMVRARLDQRLSGRVDEDDILQEAFIDAAKRIQHFAEHHSQSLFVWLRMIVSQTIINVHRRHLGATGRDAKRDRSISRLPPNPANSTSMALQLLGHDTPASQALMRDELAERIEEAIRTMPAMDQEVLSLRHFEHLTNSEVAEELGIEVKAASIRYTRALRRLREVLAELSDFSGD